MPSHPLYCTHCGEQIDRAATCPHCSAKNEFLKVAPPSETWNFGTGAVGGTGFEGNPRFKPDPTAIREARRGAAGPTEFLATDPVPENRVPENRGPTKPRNESATNFLDPDEIEPSK